MASYPFGSGDNRRMVKQDVTIRRAPRMWSFMVTGGIVGFLVALVATTVSPIDPAVGFGATLGFFSIYAVTGGIFLGGLVGVFFDRRSRVTHGVAEVTEKDPADS